MVVTIIIAPGQDETGGHLGAWGGVMQGDLLELGTGEFYRNMRIKVIF